MDSKVADLIFFPLRALLSNEAVERMGLTSLERERIEVVKNYLKGRTLDVACGYANRLAELQEGIIGLDINFYPKIDLQGDSQRLPIKDGAVDNIVILSSLDYIPDKVRALKECHRALKKRGKIFITNINPLFCSIRWKLAFWNKYSNPKRGGFWKREILELFAKSNFDLIKHKRFVCGLNNLYIGEKA